MLTQLETEEWEELAKDVLKNWYYTDELDRHPLTELTTVSRQWQTAVYADDAFRKAKALRDVVKSVIAELKPEGETPPDPEQDGDPRWMQKRWRYHNILTLLPKYAPGEIAPRLGLALGGQYYRDQGKAIQILAYGLRNGGGWPDPEPFLLELGDVPGGAVKLADPFYVERDADSKINKALSSPRKIVTIRGSRQVGKTSLLIRGINRAKQSYGARVVYFDLQRIGKESLTSLDDFLHTIAHWIFDKLELDSAIIEEVWRSGLTENMRLDTLLEQYVLPKVDEPILLAMDEIDRLQFMGFHTQFFGLIRSWYNIGAYDARWEKLSTIMAISTEPYLLINDLTQSPFNIGLTLNLQDFNYEQVTFLNTQYEKPISDDELPPLMSLLNGHPYLTRMALYTIAADRLSWGEFEAVALSDQGPFYQHLQRQYRFLIQDETLRQALKEIVHSNHCSDETAGFRLMKAGLVTSEGDRYFLRCGLYQRYFAGKL